MNQYMKQGFTFIEAQGQEHQDNESMNMTQTLLKEIRYRKDRIGGTPTGPYLSVKRMVRLTMTDGRHVYVPYSTADGKPDRLTGKMDPAAMVSLFDANGTWFQVNMRHVIYIETCFTAVFRKFIWYICGDGVHDAFTKVTIRFVPVTDGSEDEVYI